MLSTPWLLLLAGPLGRKPGNEALHSLPSQQAATIPFQGPPFPSKAHHSLPRPTIPFWSVSIPLRAEHSHLSPDTQVWHASQVVRALAVAGEHEHGVLAGSGAPLSSADLSSADLSADLSSKLAQTPSSSLPSSPSHKRSRRHRCDGLPSLPVGLPVSNRFAGCKALAPIDLPVAQLFQMVSSPLLKLRFTRLHMT